MFEIWSSHCGYETRAPLRGCEGSKNSERQSRQGLYYQHVIPLLNPVPRVPFYANILVFSHLQKTGSEISKIKIRPTSMLALIEVKRDAAIVRISADAFVDQSRNKSAH